MTPRQFILVFGLIIFALLTSMTADVCGHRQPPTPPRARESTCHCFTPCSGVQGKSCGRIAIGCNPANARRSTGP